MTNNSSKNLEAGDYFVHADLLRKIKKAYLTYASV
jgi:hypothetical protein